jgi:hypothetical protein
MRTIFFVLFFSTTVSSSICAQSRIQTMLEQIAKLQIYIKVLEKGYNIANAGLTLIGDIKNGDFHLHTDYFNSLEKVNPKIKNFSKVAEIISMEIEMASMQKNSLVLASNAGVFSSTELKYFSDCYSYLSSTLNSDLDQLINVTTDDVLQMKDDERINRIDKLYTSVLGKYKFITSFSNEIKIHSQQKKNDLLDINTIKKIFQP